MDSKLTKLKKQAHSALDRAKTDTVIEHLSAVESEYKRVTEVSRAPMVLINDIETQFQKATKLTPLDTTFLFVATALQMVRQLHHFLRERMIAKPQKR